MQTSFSTKDSTNIFMNLQGTCRGLTPSKPLAPLLALDAIGNKINSHFSRALANRTWLWKLHMVSQSSVNYILQKDEVSPLLYNFHPSAATASKCTWQCIEPGIWELGFQSDQWPPDACFSSTSARAGTTKWEGMGGRERDCTAAAKSYIRFSQQPHVLRKPG